MKCLTKDCNNEASAESNYCTPCKEAIDKRDRRRIFKAGGTGGYGGGRQGGGGQSGGGKAGGGGGGGVGKAG